MKSFDRSVDLAQSLVLSNNITDTYVMKLFDRSVDLT